MRYACVKMFGVNKGVKVFLKLHSKFSNIYALMSSHTVRAPSLAALENKPYIRQKVTVHIWSLELG